MDKAYVDFEALCAIDSADAYFITRVKVNMRYEVIDANYIMGQRTFSKSFLYLNEGSL
ncbi:MAG: hypothetical protein SNH27_08040 [Rikenellaceae bacterium]